MRVFGGDLLLRKWGRQIIIILIALIIAGEGTFLMLNAGDANIEGFMDVNAGSVFLAGSIHIILGLLLIFSLLYESFKPYGEAEKDDLKVWGPGFIQYIVGLVLTFEGLVLLFNAGPAELEGFSHLRLHIVVILSTQLVLLGLVVTLLNSKSKMVSQRNWLSSISLFAFSFLILTEGLMLAGLAGDSYIDNFSSVRESYVFLAGIQLAILGAMILVPVLTSDQILRIRDRKISMERYSTWIILLVGAMLALEGIIVVVLSDAVNIEGFSSIREQYVVVFGAQLVIVGLGMIIAWAKRNVDVSWKLIPETVGYLVGLTLLLGGLGIYGVAGDAGIDDFGGVREIFVLIIGLLMAIIGSAIVLNWLLFDKKIVVGKIIATEGQKTLFGNALSMAVIAEAIAALSIVDNTLIEGFGSIRASYMQLFWNFKGWERSEDFKRNTIVAGIFIIMMAVPAFIF